MTASLGGIRYVIGFVLEADRRRALAVAFLTLATALAPPLIAVALSSIVAAAGRDDASAAALGVALVATGLGIVNAASRVQGNLQDYLSSKAAVLLDRRVIEQACAPVDIEHFERADYLDRLSLVRGKGGDLVRGSWSLALVAAMAIQAAVVTVLLATVDLRLLLVPLGFLPALALSVRAQGHVERVQLETEAAAREERSIHALFSTPSAAMELRSHDCSEAIGARADELWSGVVRKRFRASLGAALMSAPGWLLTSTAVVAALWVALDAFDQGTATLAGLLLVWQLVGQLRTTTSEGATALRDIAKARAAVDRFLWLEAYTESVSMSAETDVAEIPSAGDLELSAVSYGYPGTDRIVLEAVDLRLRAGSTVAVVGANGAGKTTLTKLLCGLYRPVSGRIRYGDVDLATMDPTAWRSRVAVCFQDHLRLETAARESVGAGDLASIDDDAAIEEALRTAQASDLLASLSAGLETHLGKTYRVGVDLSGGGWQKVATARAMLRPAPTVLVLDEPTAALDPPSEHALFAGFADGSAAARRSGAITVLVSHRFSTVQMADHIVVLDRGRVVEQGTHPELLASGGKYSEMFRLQAAAYGT